MMQMSNLRYKISDWHQLVNVLSNNSRNLSIKVTDLINSDVLTGVQISVCYVGYEYPVFSYIITPAGAAVTPSIGNESFMLTKDQILSELAKWGFDVEFPEVENLPADLIEYLTTLDGLGFDKLRLLPVKKTVMGKTFIDVCVVAFFVKDNPTWIDNTIIISDEEFKESLRRGSCINLTSISKTDQWDWSWLNFVANIEDILQENQS
jgi:hypothetical protein